MKLTTVQLQDILRADGIYLGCMGCDCDERAFAKGEMSSPPALCKQEDLIKSLAEKINIAIEAKLVKLV